MSLPFRTYCLGYEHTKCATCKNERTWQTLNQLPDALRKPIQAGMKHVSVDACRLLGMGAYDEVAR